MQNLDSTDLAILKAIAARQDILTREVEDIVFLSRTQVLRRLRRLEERGLIVKRNGEPGKAYRYRISSEVVPQDFEASYVQGHDPVARQSLGVLLQGMRVISNQLAELASRIEGILK